MSYIEGFVVPVPTDKRDAYKAISERFFAKIKDWGAIRHVESWGDDVPVGKQTDFRRAVDAEDGETVVFSWIEWPSKDVRDAAQKKMMDDPEMSHAEMPFDGKRMIFGGFVPLFDSAETTTDLPDPNRVA